MLTPDGFRQIRKMFPARYEVSAPRSILKLD